MSQLKFITQSVPQTEKLFAEFPFDLVMNKLVTGMQSCTGRAYELVSEISTVPEVEAALWLYVDDLQRAHELVQSLSSPIAKAWHAVIHRREGDFGNSRYWWQQAGVPSELGTIKGYFALEFVDQVASLNGINSPQLAQIQRKEWLTLTQASLYLGA